MANHVNMRFFLRKNARLKSEKEINDLFLTGKVFFNCPIKLLLLRNKANSSECKLLISVSKKKFKKAVNRNLLKRRMRETLRLHLHKIKTISEKKDTGLHIAVLYISKEILSYHTIEKAILELLDQIELYLEKD